MMYSIPVYQPNLGGNEKKYVNDCLDTVWISSRGKYVSEFEKQFAAYVGSKYAIAVTNGTVALHLALLGLGIKAGDEVIVPTFTYIATVNVIMYVGAKPVFADSCVDTWQIDCDDVERKISKQTKAIIAPHLYGHPCDMIRLKEIADVHGLLLVEDCAEALGAKCLGTHVGNFSNVAAYSFFGNKTITTGEGGMVVTNDEKLYDYMALLKNQGMSSTKRYWHTVIGYNFRMTNIAAAIGLAQLERADELIAKKRQVAMLYEKYLCKDFVTFHKETVGVTHSFWMCSILVKKGYSRDELCDALDKKGVETRPLFYPVHLMPMYNVPNEVFPVAEDISSRGINLPSYPDLTEEQVTYICGVINGFFQESKAGE